MNLLFMNCCLEHHEYTILMSIHILNIPLHRDCLNWGDLYHDEDQKIQERASPSFSSTMFCRLNRLIERSDLRRLMYSKCELELHLWELMTRYCDCSEILKGLQEMIIHDILSYDLLYFICKKNLSFYFLSSPVLFVYILSTQGKRLWSSSMVEN
jgi:hypothetical protein